MSKSKLHKNEANPADRESADDPIYQRPSGADGQQPIADSRELTANSPRRVEASSTEPWPVEAFSTGQQPAAPRPCGEDKINLLDYFRIIYKYKWMILCLTLSAMVLAGFLIMRQPRMYQASASIVPPIDMLMQQGGLASRLGGRASLLQGMFGKGSLAGLYVDILKSRVVSDAMIQRFDLMEVYKEAETRTDARNVLKRNTSIETSKEGIVYVAVRDLDPKKAAALSNAYVEELDRQNKRLSGSQTTSKRVFLENRLKEIQDELSKIDHLQRHEVRIKEMILEMLAQECELAKIEEAKSMPTIQVLDSAEVPEIGVGRGTVRRAQFTGIVAFMLGVFLAFTREYIAGLKGQHTCRG